MNLLQALHPGRLPRIAFVGSGGKTTALFQLGRQLLAGAPERGFGAFQSVLVTASTHLAVQQLILADQYFQIETLSDLAAVADRRLERLVVLIGPPEQEERLGCLSGSLLDGVLALGDSKGLPILVEADGSRRRPLKAPADHEPPIPPWVDTVVVSAGLSGLGKPLDAPWVHRPERFAALAGLVPGAIIQPEHLRRVLTSPHGGLKNIPAGCRRAALLNQADTPELQAAGLRLAEGLKDDYPLVMIAALLPEDGAPGQVYAAVQPVAGIVLAAGGATRFGKPKQVLEWQGETLVRRAARTALEAGLTPVLVVTGAYAAETALAVSDLPVQLVDNPEWSTGQGTSVAAGVKALPPETGAAVFLLADQPNVPVTLLQGLVARHAQSLAPIVAPLVDGQRGNPVLFDRSAFSKLASLHGDTGGRALYSAYPVDWLPWHDASLLEDIDRVEDYQRLVENHG